MTDGLLQLVRATDPLAHHSGSALGADPGTVLRSAVERLAASPTRRNRWPVFVAGVAAVALAVATGVAIAGGIPGFDAWLSGKPGRPAAQAAQQRFQQNSWWGFPSGTRLRLLVSGEAAGVRYVLYGFRSGNSLCLTLRAGPRGNPPECASAATLQRLPAPILPIAGNDLAYEQGGRRYRPEVSFGIVADGVTKVHVTASDGSHQAWLGGDAYLWVNSYPDTGSRALSVTATARATTTTVQLAGPDQIPGSGAPLPRPRGPARIQATIPQPTIGWLDRREPVGLATDVVKPNQFVRRQIPAAGFMRYIRPDPLGNVVVGVGEHRVFYDSLPRGWIKPPYFSKGPVRLLGVAFGSQHYLSLTGIAADGVARVTFFLADGQIQTASLTDNVFTALVPRSLPLRIVGYDPDGRVVDTQTYGIDTRTDGIVRAATALTLAPASYRPIIRVSGPHHAKAVLAISSPDISDLLGTHRCWRATFSDGQSQSGCEQEVTKHGGVAATWVIGAVQPVGRDVFVIVHTAPGMGQDRLLFGNEDVLTARPTDGFAIFAIPRAHLSTKEQHALLLAYDNRGRQTNEVDFGRFASIPPALRKAEKRMSRGFRETVYFHASG